MARKQLKRGPNASRVTKRIAEAPHDLSDKNIFTVLKEMEDQEQPQSFVEKKQTTIISMADRRKETEPATPPPVIPQKKKNPQKPAAAVTPVENDPLPQEIVFTEEEKEIIKKAVMDYRNRLPMYLKAMKPKIDAVHRIVAKIKATQKPKHSDDEDF